MLEAFVVLSHGGLVVWSTGSSSPQPINGFIGTVLLEERGNTTTYSDDRFTLKWLLANDVGLIFIAVYQKAIELPFVDDLLAEVRRRFCTTFLGDGSPKPARELARLRTDSFVDRFEKIFHDVRAESERKRSAPKPMRSFAETAKGKKVLGKKPPSSSSTAAAKRLAGSGNDEHEEEEEEEDDAAEDAAETTPNGSTAAAPSSSPSTTTTTASPSSPSSVPSPPPSSSPPPPSVSPDGTAPAAAAAPPSPSPVDGGGVLDPEAGRRKLAELQATATRGRSASGKPMRRPTTTSGKNASKQPAAAAAEKKGGKKPTKWVEDAATPEELAKLDASGGSSSGSGGGGGQQRPVGVSEEQRRQFLGSSDGDGDEDGEEEEEESEAVELDERDPGAKKGFFSFFSNLTNKVLERRDLEPVLAHFRDHLIAKNVAAEIADRLCESVCQSLIGTKQSSFKNVHSTVRAAVEAALVRILTPKRNVDILRDVMALKQSPRPRPFSIVFVGVNGVGKSTNLAKVCYWLQQNGLKVMIAACDTFRSAAVEQLRVHAECLNVHLFERGYGKDAANVAAEGINYGKENGYDVVLIDTAGRMENNEPLMRALTKLIALNRPDLILFVGEALVGNKAVEQLTKFNQALREFSNSPDPRIIDGILLTKFDTIDDKVGAALSMVYSTGQPIVFLGTGQHYHSLKTFTVQRVVTPLMKV